MTSNALDSLSPGSGIPFKCPVLPEKVGKLQNSLQLAYQIRYLLVHFTSIHSNIERNKRFGLVDGEGVEILI